MAKGAVGSITSRCSRNEPALTSYSGGIEDRTRENGGNRAKGATPSSSSDFVNNFSNQPSSLRVVLFNQPKYASHAGYEAMLRSHQNIFSRLPLPPSSRNYQPNVESFKVFWKKGGSKTGSNCLSRAIY